MFQTQNSKKYDLEDRTFDFARDIRNCLKQINKTTASVEDIKQLVRSSGPVAANYIEANEALSKKDFAMRIKICRKEAKESKLWLRLLASESVTNPTINNLIQEATELTKIFGSMVEKPK